MASKEKDSDQLTKTTTPVEKELNEEVIKTQLKESVEYHNKLATEEKSLIDRLNNVRSALSESAGRIKTLQGFQNEYFVTDVPSDNGSA